MLVSVHNNLPSCGLCRELLLSCAHVRSGDNAALSGGRVFGGRVDLRADLESYLSQIETRKSLRTLADLVEEMP
jgi:hypothetical protein